MNAIPFLLSLTFVTGISRAAQTVVSGRAMPLVAAGQTTAPYDALTNDLCEVANFHPEPFAGIAIDTDGGVLAVNPYNNTWVKYASPSATHLALRVPTGNNPVSIGVWNPGSPSERRVLVVCTGSHALFLHAPDDGRILRVLQLDSEPGDLAIDHENDWAFVSCRGDNTVVKINLVTFQVADRYPIGCGQRPGPLHLDGGDPQVAGDTRVYVASMVTGNNSTFGDTPTSTVGFVVDLENTASELPDEDAFRIDPFLSGAAAVSAVVKNAGSLIFELARHPSGELWILSTDSNNKDSVLDTEPELQGKIVVNQLKLVAGVDATSALVEAGAGIDLDDWQPNVSGLQYDPAHSLNQARTLAFQTDGEAFVASPMSDVIAELGPDGKRTGELALPDRAQCFALKVYPPDESIVLALCLGTMTVEVFTEGNPVPARPLPLGGDPTPASVRRGRDIMSDGQISSAGRSSCFACHPGGRSDHLGWSIAGAPTDIKDVMVTQSLLSIADTFPHHWRGERDLQDFRKAFVGLLGAPAALEPAVEQMEDVNAFMRSLKAPANPIQNYRRIVDDKQSPGPAPNGMTGSAVLGQELFSDPTKINFNGNTCAECHQLETGTNDNMFFEVLGTLAPRAQEVEVAHLRQLQHKGLDTVVLGNGVMVNENGFGAAHNGGNASVFEFIFDNFPDLEDFELVHIFKYVEQWDQGIAPGAHWTTWFDSSSGIRTVREIEQILIAGAEAAWLDVVAFGRFDEGAGPQEVRWLYDPAQDLFVNDHPLVGNKTWNQFKLASAAGLAEHAFLGVPLGNGFRVAFDPDADDLATGAELTAGTNPWAPDTDRDGWPDGYEVENGENPLVQQASPGDDVDPQLVGSSLEFATARLAKYHARFSEDVRYVVEYGLPGGQVLAFEQPDFVRADTFVLTHSAPSSPIPPLIHKPEPDGATVFSATITLTDRAGRVTGPVPLGETFTPVAAQFEQGLPGAFVHVESITASSIVTGQDSLTATVTIEPRLHYLDPAAFPPSHFPADGQMVFCNVAVDDVASGHFVQSSSFTTAPSLPTQFFLSDGVTNPSLYVATPGPFVVCDLVQNGATQFTFTQGGLVPGQRVKIAVQGVLMPVDHTQQIYNAFSLFNFQPLLTEEFHELELQF